MCESEEIRAEYWKTVRPNTNPSPYGEMGCGEAKRKKFAQNIKQNVLFHMIYSERIGDFEEFQTVCLSPFHWQKKKFCPSWYIFTVLGVC